MGRRVDKVDMALLNSEMSFKMLRLDGMIERRRAMNSGPFATEGHLMQNIAGHEPSLLMPKL